jgi:hypothetical protein
MIAVNDVQVVVEGAIDCEASLEQLRYEYLLDVVDISAKVNDAL